MPAVLTEELIMADLEMLSHGGKEAIALFMEMSRRLHEESAIDGMQDWVTIAAPALPEKERNEVIVMLMGSHLSRQSKREWVQRLRHQPVISKHSRLRL